MRYDFTDVRVCEAIKPQTMGSARSGDWVSLKGFRRCRIVIHIAQGHASGSAITVDKATAVDGTGESTGITLNNWWSLTDTPTTADAYTKGTAAASITTSTAGSGSSIYIIDIDAAELGETSGVHYDCIQLEAGSSNASNLLSAVYCLYGARYPQALLPTAITD